MPYVRLSWRSDLELDTELIEFSSAWVESSSEVRKVIERTVAIANEIYGEGSHWSEEAVEKPSPPA